MRKLKKTIRFYTVLISFISVIIVFCNAAMPLVVKNVTDFLVEKKFEKINQELALYILLILVVLLCEYASKVFDARFKNVLITMFRRLLSV